MTRQLLISLLPSSLSQRAARTKSWSSTAAHEVSPLLPRRTWATATGLACRASERLREEPGSNYMARLGINRNLNAAQCMVWSKQAGDKLLKLVRRAWRSCRPVSRGVVGALAIVYLILGTTLQKLGVQRQARKIQNLGTHRLQKREQQMEPGAQTLCACMWI